MDGSLLKQMVTYLRIFFPSRRETRRSEIILRIAGITIFMLLLPLAVVSARQYSPSAPSTVLLAQQNKKADTPAQDLEQQAEKQVQLGIAACSLLYGELFLDRNEYPDLDEVVEKMTKKTVGDTSFVMHYHPAPEKGVITVTASKDGVEASGKVKLR